MDVEIEGGCNVRMTQKGANCLVVSVAFYATGGKTKAKTVVFQVGNSKLIHQFAVVIAVGARLRGFLVVRQDVIIVIDHLLQLPCHRQQFFRHGNLPIGVMGWRRE